MTKSTYTMEELSAATISEFISEERSFTINKVNPLQFSSIVRSIETTMDTQGKRYITYSEGRARKSRTQARESISYPAQNGIDSEQTECMGDYEISKSYFLSTIHVRHKNHCTEN